MTKRIFILVVAMLLSVAGVFAQDIIKKCNDEEIKAIVQEVGNYEITYKLFNSPNGETKILKKDLIHSILFSSGNREVFNCQEVTKTKQSEPPKEEQEPAQVPFPDLIILTDGEVIEGFVKEIGYDDVAYIKAQNPNGPSYILKQSSILKIRYANGMEDKFTIPPPLPEEEQVVVVTKPIREEVPQYQSKPERTYETENKSNPNKFRFYLGTGFGNSYGILGTNLEFRFSHFAFHGGLGWYPLAEIETPAWSVGIKGYLWKNMYLNTVVGTVGHYELYEYNYYYYSTVEYKLITGISELFGYQWAWGDAVRFGLNVGAGFFVGFVDKTLYTGSLVGFAFDVGISINFGTKK